MLLSFASDPSANATFVQAASNFRVLIKMPSTSCKMCSNRLAAHSYLLWRQSLSTQSLCTTTLPARQFRRPCIWSPLTMMRKKVQLCFLSSVFRYVSKCVLSVLTVSIQSTDKNFNAVVDDEVGNHRIVNFGALIGASGPVHAFDVQQVGY